MDFNMTVLRCGFNDYFKYPYSAFPKEKFIPKWMNPEEVKLYRKGWAHAKLQCSGS